MIRAEVSNSLDVLVYRKYPGELTDCYLYGCLELLSEYHSVKLRKPEKQFRFSVTENPLVHIGRKDC